MAKKTDTQLLKGVIQVTGEHDSGKTTFALEAGASPDRILFFDDDLKGRATIDDLEEMGVLFGRYVDLTSIAVGKNEYDFHMAVINILKEIKPGDYDLIVWDTWTHFAASCYDYVMKNPNEFRGRWSPKGTIKGAQQWQSARLYEAAIISRLSELATTVILVTHLKDFYMGDVKVPGKQIPASSKALDRIMRMRIWLRQNPSGRPVPIGLVLKRLDRKVLVDGKIRTVSVLPRKIVPSDEEHSLWDTIWDYWERPYGDREPEEDEIPDEYELSILSNTLTKDQLKVMTTMIEHDLIRVEEEGNAESVHRVISAHREGKALPIVAKEAGVSIVRAKEIIDNLPPEDEEFMEKGE